jgi:hypothetical protein
MDNVVVSFAYFLLGFLLGSGAVMGYGMYSLKKAAKKKQATLKALQKTQQEKQNMFESIKKRLVEAQDLTQKQFELLAELDAPSKNALHSKYKNQIIHELRKIEDEKMIILRSILSDGFDPEIAIINDRAEKEKVKLSEYLSRMDDKESGETPPPEPPPESGITVKKVGKFFVYSGGGAPTSNSEEPNH